MPNVDSSQFTASLKGRAVVQTLNNLYINGPKPHNVFGALVAKSIGPVRSGPTSTSTTTTSTSTTTTTTLPPVVAPLAATYISPVDVSSLPAFASLTIPTDLDVVVPLFTITGGNAPYLVAPSNPGFVAGGLNYAVQDTTVGATVYVAGTIYGNISSDPSGTGISWVNSVNSGNGFPFTQSVSFVITDDVGNTFNTPTLNITIG